MTKETVVIGIGNPLRGDDGVGWAVVEALAEVAEAWGLTAVYTHQLLPELIDEFRCAGRVVFVDASVSGEAGAVTVTAVPPTTNGPAASHQMHPGVLLALGMKLYGRMPSAYLITVTGQDFGYQETLTVPVQQSIAAVLRQIQQLVNAPTPISGPTIPTR